jgi:hypothetical protein
VLQRSARKQNILKIKEKGETEEMKKAYLMIIAIACTFVIATVSIPSGLCHYGPAATETMPHTTATIQLEIIGMFTENISATGPVEVYRGTPYDPGDGHIKINTTMVSMNLVGTSVHIGTVTIFINPHYTSNGTIRQVNKGQDFPANSSFDVFVEINTTLPYPNNTLHYDQPVLMYAQIHRIPPWNTNYTSLTPPIPLKNMNNATIGFIQHVSHDTGPSPLAVTISPTSATIPPGQSVYFTETVTGEVPPCIEQWYLNGNPVSGANQPSWTFTPLTPGIYHVWKQVTDNSSTVVVSPTATIDVTLPVGGIAVPVGNFGLLGSYIGLVSTLAVAAVATAICTKHDRRREEKH